MNGKLWIGVILAVVCASSAGVRHVVGDQNTTSKSTSSALSGGSTGITGGSSFAPTSGTARSSNPQPVVTDDETDSFIAKSLPFLTEASFFGLIGFALGYFSRKVVKLMMIFVAIIFIAMQVLTYLEVANIDWQKLIDILNGLILNLKENDSISAVLKDRIPTAGALVAGYFLGFRRG